MSYRSFLSVVLAMIVIGIVGCGDDNPTAARQELIARKWVIFSTVFDGTVTTDFQGSTLELRTDKTMRMTWSDTISSPSWEGTWTLLNNDQTLELRDESNETDVLEIIELTSTLLRTRTITNIGKVIDHSFEPAP